MGLWEVFDDGVKKTVSNAYNLGRAAVSKTIDGASKMDETVRMHGDGVKQKVKEYLPGPEGKEKIVQALTHPVTKEAIKFVSPAQAAYNIVLLLGKHQNQDGDHEQKNKYEHVIRQQLNVLQAENENKYEHVIQQLNVLQAENERMLKEHNQLMIINKLLLFLILLLLLFFLVNSIL